eukprot:366470-Chlamydomonas_euryale.AAC.14
MRAGVRACACVSARRRTCAASPPAPWQHGTAPNQQPTRFIAPTDAATRDGANSDPARSGKSCRASAVTAMTELSMVSGSCTARCSGGAVREVEVRGVRASTPRVVANKIGAVSD